MLPSVSVATSTCQHRTAQRIELRDLLALQFHLPRSSPYLLKEPHINDEINPPMAAPVKPTSSESRSASGASCAKPRVQKHAARHSWLDDDDGLRLTLCSSVNFLRSFLQVAVQSSRRSDRMCHGVHLVRCLVVASTDDCRAIPGIQARFLAETFGEFGAHVVCLSAPFRISASSRRNFMSSSSSPDGENAL